MPDCAQMLVQTRYLLYALLRFPTVWASSEFPMCYLCAIDSRDGYTVINLE